MATSTSVARPRSTKCIFPDRCVVCGREHPGHTVRVSSRATGWYTLVFWSFGASHAVDVPMCPQCGRAFLRHRRLRTVGTWAAAVAAAGLALHVLRSYQGPAKAWLAMGIALLAIGPWILWEVFAAPAFDLSVGEKKIDYEFRDEACAREFAALNPKSDE